MRQCACPVLVAVSLLVGSGCVCPSTRPSLPASPPEQVKQTPSAASTVDGLGIYHGRSFDYWLARYQARDEKRRAVKALGFQGPPAIPELTAALSDPDWAVRAEAAYALGYMGPRAWTAVPRLKRLRHDPDEHVRNAAVFALQKIAPEPRRRGSVEL